MDKDVVLVTVQYRLGPLGWMSLDTDDIPGNAGVFDVIESLRWGQQFIKYFGGDPSCVTVSGESAGSVIGSMLLLAPQARGDYANHLFMENRIIPFFTCGRIGLFHRVIGQSGSILTPWALDRNPVENAKKVAEIAGCPLEPYAALSSCLRTLPASNITKAYHTFEVCHSKFSWFVCHRIMRNFDCIINRK